MNSSGKIFPSGVAADSYKKAVDSAIQNLKHLEANDGYHDDSVNVTSESHSLVFLTLFCLFAYSKLFC